MTHKTTTYFTHRVEHVVVVVEPSRPWGASTDHRRRLRFLQGHRPPTRDLQASLSWASFSRIFHSWPVLLMSASNSRRQVFLGRPLFRFPWGFHFRACHVILEAGFLSVWPIYLHRFWRISSSMGFCFVRCHSSRLLILSLAGQNQPDSLLENFQNWLE